MALNSTDITWRAKAVAFIVGGLGLLSLPYVTSQRTTRAWGWVLLWVIGVWSWHIFRPLLWIPADGRITWDLNIFICGLQLLVGLLVLQRLVQASTDPQAQWTRVFYHLMQLGILHAAYCIGQRFDLHEFGYMYPLRKAYMAGLMGNSLVAATFHVMILPMTFLFRGWWAWCGRVIILAAVFLSLSRISMLAGFGSLFLFLVCQRRWKPVAAMVILAIAGSLAYANTYGQLLLNFGQRPLIWQHVLTYWQQHPWIGHGPGGVAYTFGLTQLPNLSAPFVTAHNDYLQGLADMGLIGMSLLAVAVLNLLWRLWRVRTHPLAASILSILCATAITMSVGFPLMVAPSAAVALLVVAAGEALTTEGGVHGSA